MKFESSETITVCLAIILCGGLFGCSTAEHRPAITKEQPQSLFLHLIASYEYPDPPLLIASVPVHLSTNFDFLTEDKQHFTGRVDSKNGKYFVHFQIYLYDGTNYFDGDVELDKPDDPGTRPWNDKTPFVYQPMFILSQNPCASPFLKRQGTAMEEYWRRWNPLTPPQIAKVEQRFRLMHPGMTENEVFVLLGLSPYLNLLHDPRMFRSGDWWSFDDYQLGYRKVLELEVDCGCKTNFTKLPDGKTAIEIVDNAYLVGHKNCIVVRATLGPETWSKDRGFGTTTQIELGMP